MSNYNFNDTGLDVNNPRAFKYYIKCSEVADTPQKLNSLLNITPFFYVYIFGSLFYLLTTTVVLFHIKNKHTIRYNYFKLSLLFVIGYLLLIVHSILVDVYIYLNKYK